MDAGKDDRSLGELLSDLMRQVTTLVRQEIELARTEISANASRAGRNVASLLVGGAVLYAGVLFLLYAIVLLLATAGLPGWLAALIVGGAVAVAGAFLVMRGRDALQREDLLPKRTIETLKEDAEWASDQTTSTK